MSKEEREDLRNRRVAAVRAILKTDPTISIDVLTRRVAMATQHRDSESTVHGIVSELQRRKTRSKTNEAGSAAPQANES